MLQIKANVIQDGPRMNVLWTKIVSMSVLASVSLIVGFIPMLLVKKVILKP